MRSLLSQFLAIGPELAAFIFTSPLLASRGVYAIAQSAAPSPNLNLASLGSVAIGGDFDTISLFTYNGQSEDIFTTNGSQSLLTQFPNGAFDSLGIADGSIMAMCPLVEKDGSLNSVIVGGNFTSLGGVAAQAIAAFNPNTSHITALPGLNGKVNAVYCDSTSGTVYVGGSFLAGNSTNAMAWTTEWTNLPFAGFNGPVNSVTKNAAGNIVFGGNFDGLGNTSTPAAPEDQVVNLGSGNISASGTTTTVGFNNPRSIICKTAAQGGSNNTWLLADNTAGWWQANFSFGFNPTKLRLYNTLQPNRGTKSWYFEDMNSGGINKFTYVDTNGVNQSCYNNCPLPQNNATYQDFHFAPSVGMSNFRIYITEWYGDGGGLDGIEMFQNDIYSFAIDAFNEPKCDDVSNGSTSIISPSTGVWNVVENHGNTTSNYLSAFLVNSSEVSPSTSVVFEPDIKQSGNYSITVYTPGCLQDDSCPTRGLVNITGTTTSNDPPFSTIVYQTNDYDKYDQVYYGYVDVDTASFKPRVTLTPQTGQNVPLTVVAQRVRFELIDSTGGLNGLFEYDPNQAVVTTDFSQSAIDTAGEKLNSGALVNAVVEIGKSLLVAGNFSGNGVSNVMSVNENATALANGGLDSAVQTLWVNGSLVYMGGDFTNTADNSITGLNSVAVYDTTGNSWSTLGAGVNGTVYGLVPIALNITGDSPEQCLAVSGDFVSVNGFDGNAAFSTDGFAVWVPSRKNWLNNIPDTSISINGKLLTFTDVPGSSPLYAGQIIAQGSKYSDAVGLVGSGQPSLVSLGVKIQPGNSGNSSSSLQKRDISSSQNFTGVYDGLWYTTNNLNITILAGHFTANASNGSSVQNLVFINNTNGAKELVTGVSGLDNTSTFVAMDYYDSILYAGGVVSGSVNGNPVGGIIKYDLATASFAPSQPPALVGDNVIVNTIEVQPNSGNVYVGGAFTSAGALPCASLCYYDASTMQWNSPGSGLGGTISDMVWTSNTELVIAGNLTVEGNSTVMAVYDAKKQTFAEYTSASSLPGPVTVLAPANGQYNEFWAAGVATKNGSSYLSRYNNNAWTGVGGLGAGTVIRGLQMLPLNQNHGNTALVTDNEVLMITGNVNVPGFGNASAVLFNGTSFEPFCLTNREDGSQGTISSMFVSNPSNYMNGEGHYLALGLVVLIGLAIALGLIFCIVVGGIFVERHRRRREGYVPMQVDKSGNMQRIPPESLLGNLGEKGNAPKL
ncbi:hypothetical protein M433DRAFT_56994 [Acidomyces richmondensis BFW]|nr:MAG: hypothetical protein FE78DRAFT_156598 [Acidomyces sp. 'richmondensis']KYG50511.1 hypothetical protein M433DRAFT_56994 [Acidomyces richmondensis BFW]